MKIKAIGILVSGALLSAAFCPGTGKSWKTIGREEMSAVFKKTEQAYASLSSYTVTVSHTSFENYDTDIKHEQSKGYYKRLDKNYHSYLLGVHTIQNEKVRLIIDSSQKSIVLTNPETVTQVTFSEKEYADLVESCKAIKVSAENGKDTRYRLEYNEDKDIVAQEFTIDKDGFITSMVMYYSRYIIRNDKEELIKPRLEIQFTGFTKGGKLTKQEFSENNFLDKTGDKYTLKSNYKSFKFYDNRIVK